MRPNSFLQLFLSCVLLVLSAVALRGQSVNMNRPPEVPASRQTPAEAMKSRMNNVRLQQDAKDLGELCASLPSDMEGLKQGLLAKDLVERLKRVEKLSKRVREELTQ